MFRDNFGPDAFTHLQMFTFLGNTLVWCSTVFCTIIIMKKKKHQLCDQLDERYYNKISLLVTLCCSPTLLITIISMLYFLKSIILNLINVSAKRGFSVEFLIFVTQWDFFVVIK